MSTVAQILRSKPDRTVHTIAPTATVYDALRFMAEKNIGGLVVAEGGKIAGLVTERDYARKVVLLAKSSKEIPVSEIMTAQVKCVSPERTSEECLAIMTENRFRHLPVLEQGKLVGLVSIGDLVKDVISEQKFRIEQLEHYIAG
ncbi:MAG: CBS domain-containing protein [Betaproteobacteria bacterium]|nr:CBS domain-containing protein [Betaproteobacteria bacterium]MDH5220414.1 CBS domain-containing protein [Betaproteobacteria bacterium]MDH5351473.1 CBS domain-containing protein [Betaproteobacteria bacterium]